MEIETENFIVALTDETPTHEQWLAVVRFGLGTLLENQRLLAEVIVREAQRETRRFNEDRVTGCHEPSDHVAQILDQLNLRLTLAG